MHSDWVDVFPIKNGDIPASYVSLPERNPIEQWKNPGVRYFPWNTRWLIGILRMAYYDPYITG